MRTEIDFSRDMFTLSIGFVPNTMKHYYSVIWQQNLKIYEHF